TLQIQGDATIYVRGPLSVEGASSITVAGGGRLKIFAAGAVTLGGQGIRNRTGLLGEGIPSRAQLLVGRDLGLPDGTANAAVRVATTASQFAVIYAPKRAVDIDTRATIYGAVIGDVVRAHD